VLLGMTGGNIRIDISLSGCSNSNPQTRRSFAARPVGVPDETDGKKTII